MFQSVFKELGPVALPAFSNTRVMMMPVILGDIESIPSSLAHWRSALAQLFAMGGHAGEVGYLTIDEKIVQPGLTHRRRGLHVDGVFKDRPGAWGSMGTGMLTVSSHQGCRAWQQAYEGWPGDEGECDHLAEQCRPEAETLFDANKVYWVDGLCVHESIPMQQPTARQFVRLSMPSKAPWFDGYTKNPLGVQPAGEILPRRKFMTSK